MITRRNFLKSGLALTASKYGLNSVRSASAPAIKASPDVILYEGTYPGWPWIAAAADGTLYCVFREGTVHDYSPSGKVLMSRSSDRGRTWSRAAVVVDAPDVDDRNAAIAVLPNQDLLVTYNTYTRARKSLALTVRSSDAGRTWSKSQPVGVPNTRTRSGACVLASGALLLPYYVAPGNGALAALSQNNGVSWKTVQIPDTEGFVGDEWDVLEVQPDHLIGIIRNSHPRSDGTFWMTQSRNGGQTWSVPRPTNVRSQRHPSPGHITFQGKTPTLVYADRRMVSVSAVRPKSDDWLRWDLENRLLCFQYNPDASPIQDSSYPCSVSISPRQRLIVDYEIRANSQRIAGYLVKFPENW